MAPPPFNREWQCPLWFGARGVWLYPLRSGGRSWGSGSAHWNLALAVEARQCPLRSGARAWGWSGGRGGEGGGGGGDGRHAALIKFRDFHMAGGEQMFQYVFAREHREFFSGFSAEARESVFQTRGCRERKTPHRERFAKEMAKSENRIEHKASGFRQPLCFSICFPSSTFPKRFPIGSSDRAFPVAPRHKPPSAVPRSWRCRARRWGGTCLGPAGIQVPELRKPEIRNPKSRTGTGTMKFL